MKAVHADVRTATTATARGQPAGTPEETGTGVPTAGPARIRRGKAYAARSGPTYKAWWPPCSGEEPSDQGYADGVVELLEVRGDTANRRALSGGEAEVDSQFPGLAVGSHARVHDLGVPLAAPVVDGLR